MLEGGLKPKRRCGLYYENETSMPGFLEMTLEAEIVDHQEKARLMYHRALKVLDIILQGHSNITFLIFLISSQNLEN